MTRILSAFILIIIAITACKKNTYPPPQTTPAIDTTGKDSTAVIDSPIVKPPKIVTYSLSYTGYTHYTSYNGHTSESVDTTYPDPKTVFINYIVDVDTFAILDKDTVKWHHGLYHSKVYGQYSGTQYSITDTSIDINTRGGTFGLGTNSHFHGTKK